MGSKRKIRRRSNRRSSRRSNRRSSRRSKRRSKKKGRMLSSDLSFFLSSVRDTKDSKKSLKQYEEDISNKMREEGETLVSLKNMTKGELDKFLEECGISKEFHRKRFIKYLKKYPIASEVLYPVKISSSNKDSSESLETEMKRYKQLPYDVNKEIRTVLG